MSALSTIQPLTAAAVVLATAATDAVYVMFTSAVVAKKRVPAATWSSIWYMLSSFAVISYTENWVYVLFAAVGSWVGKHLDGTVSALTNGVWFWSVCISVIAWTLVRRYGDGR